MDHEPAGIYGGEAWPPDHQHRLFWPFHLFAKHEPTAGVTATYCRYRTDTCNPTPRTPDHIVHQPKVLAETVVVRIQTLIRMCIQYIYGLYYSEDLHHLIHRVSIGYRTFEEATDMVMEVERVERDREAVTLTGAGKDGAP